MRTSIMISFVLLSCGLTCTAQDRKLNRLAEVSSVYVLLEDKRDVKYLNEVLPWTPDQRSRQQRLNWLRMVRQTVADKLAQEQTITLSKEPQLADALMSISFPDLIRPVSIEWSETRRLVDPNQIAATLSIRDRTIWKARYGIGLDTDKTAEKICEELLKALRQDREKRDRKK